MELVDCGYSGSDTSIIDEVAWNQMDIDPRWAQIAKLLSGSNYPREIQRFAIATGSILEGRKNLIVSAPTNSGKSLIGDITLLDAIRRGGRAVLIEPLRALAQEKYDRYCEIRLELERLLDQQISINISTGDYRLESEQFTSPPSDDSHLVITTPERLDAIARNPEYMPWIESIRAVCFDEAHLISSSRRGPVIEYLITFLKSQLTSPRIVLLSASVNETGEAQAWLQPCESLASNMRRPRLHKTVLTLDESENADDELCRIIVESAKDKTRTFLVFVYQTRSANGLAKRISDLINIPGWALSYHSQMSQSQRKTVRSAYCSNQARCVVATTSLALGVNLPATDVFIRDITFPGVGRLSIAEILQMAGRAGRGDMPGQAIVIRRHQDAWTQDDLVSQLTTEPLPSLKSSFEDKVQFRKMESEISDGLLEVVTTHLAKFENGLINEELKSFFENSLGGKSVANKVDQALGWLGDSCRMLVAINDDGRYVATSLGSQAIRSTIPLATAAGIGQLIRDFFELDENDKYLKAWTPLDHLILLDLLSDRQPSLRKFSRELEEQVVGWIEAFRGEKPLLFREWIYGGRGSKASELCGSLGIDCPNDETARKLGYLATFRSIVLHDRGLGISAKDLQRRWKIENLTGVEEQWRDTTLWLLNAMSHVLETRCYYYHLKENCGADTDRVKRVETCFRQMRRQLFGLQNHLKYCSPLGVLLRSLKRSSSGKNAGIGIASLRKLEAGGISGLADIAKLDCHDLQRMGMREKPAKALVAYLRRRQR